MNKLAFALVAINFVSFALKAEQPEINPSHIDAYVTPYYNSKGPEVNVGRFRADNLAFSWIRPGWEVLVALGSSCFMPRTLFINLWGPTSMVTPSETSMVS